mmetsp:Transcript_16837/g.18738  ORF Transcript_16837/g.18738 Transcript_16837/m.18738 type:complete len:109 (+) Transcript_16837:151-477(+)
MSSVVVLRIKFPETWPLIYKTLRIEDSMSTKDAIAHIAETVNCSQLLEDTHGLFMPEENVWLEFDTPISDYPQLQECEHVEFKDKNKPTQSSTNDQDKDTKACPCIIL